MATGHGPFEDERVEEVMRWLRRGTPLILAGLALLIVLLGSSTLFYRVDASDQGVVLRFGQHQRTTEPGLHMKWPWPIETVYEVPVRRVQVLEFGFRTESPGRVTDYSPETEQEMDVAEMLTGDLNLANVEWIVQYRVSDPAAYLFNMGTANGVPRASLPVGVEYDPNPAVPDTISNVAESVLRRLVGDVSVDSVLTLEREAIAVDAKREIQNKLDDFEAGVEIVTVKLQSTSPPEQVKEAFQEVNRARQNKERLVNEAKGERNSKIPAARGKRDQMISEAEGYAERIALETTGEVAAFEAQLTEYEKSPEVTRTRLYLEAMEEVLMQVDDKIILDESVEGLLPLLNLDAGNTQSGRSAAGNTRGGVR
ncbi:MAG: FtsH protease activity modulator HflK [Planctomycetota bacterium]